jgi:DNA-binding PadR family transcriptional regulator
MALAQAILATLLDCPCSGYDLRKRFQSSVGFFWQASFQQIYRELDRLEAQGLVQSQAIAQRGRPDKKVFAVTAVGEASLQDWVERPCGMAPVRDEVLVKLFAGFVVPRETILLELKRHQTLHQERLAVYRQIEQTTFANPEQLPEKQLFRYLTLCNGIQYEIGWLAWCEGAIAQLAVQ